MSITMPETVTYGKVVGRFIVAVGDAADVDKLPDPLPAVGKVTFVPAVPLSRETAATPPTTVIRSTVTCSLNSEGVLTSPMGDIGLWLVAGVYKVSYSTSGVVIPAHDILVTDQHTILSPLDLTLAQGPGGPVLKASQYADLSARIDALAGSGGTSVHGDLTGRSAADSHPMSAVTGLDAALAQKASAVDLVSQVKAPLFVSHRGGPRRFPEHSLAGYRASAMSGFAIEPDIAQLADGTLVPLHDPTVDRTMTGTGSAESFTLAQWKAMRLKARPSIDTYPVPYLEDIPCTWEEVLDEFGGRYLLIPELKNSGALAAMVDSLIRRQLQRAVIVQSFNWAVVSAAVAAGIEGLMLTNSPGVSVGITTWAAIKAAGVNYVGMSSGASDATLAAATAAGLRVIIYTVNRPLDADMWLSKGAFGVFSDDPWGASRRQVKRDSDPWAEQRPWPKVTTYGNGYLAFRAPNEIGQLQRTNGNGGSGVEMSWAGTRSSFVRVDFDLQFLENAAAQDRWLGVSVADYSESQGVFYDSAVPGQTGYHFLIRRNGALGIYLINNNAPASAIATTPAAATPLAAVGEEGEKHRIQITVNATGLSLRNLTTKAETSVANIDHRKPWRISIMFNGTDGMLSNMRVLDLP